MGSQWSSGGVQSSESVAVPLTLCFDVADGWLHLLMMVTLPVLCVPAVLVP